MGTETHKAALLPIEAKTDLVSLVWKSNVSFFLFPIKKTWWESVQIEELKKGLLEKGSIRKRCKGRYHCN